MENEKNSLINKFHLEENGAVCDFWKEPSVRTFMRVDKSDQTEEMLKTAILGGWNSFARVLKFASKKILTEELCRLACAKEGRNIKFVPLKFLQAVLCDNGDLIKYISEKEKTPELCLTAVEHSLTGDAIDSIPAKFCNLKLRKIAVESNPLALKYIPEKSVSKKMAYNAVKATQDGYTLRQALTNESIFVKAEHYPIEYVPERLRTKELEELSVQCCPSSISVIDPKYALKQQSDGENSHQHISETKTYLSTISDFSREPIKLDIPKYRKALSAKCLQMYDLTSGSNETMQSVLYISDIHLEHQINMIGKSIDEIDRILCEKIEKMVPDLFAEPKGGTILIGGDVAYSIPLEKLFYKILRNETWSSWRMISVLGNHELWDGDPVGTGKSRSIDEIVEDYRQNIASTLLENELYIKYKGDREEVIDERSLLNADDTELAEVCSNSSLLILGGIGFSKYNEKFNADCGIYRKTVSREEEIKRADRFCAVYEKVLRCARNKTVIVLTHMPFEDWHTPGYNPNWIYINGHTHQNRIVMEDGKTVVLADNQVGYRRKAWTLKKVLLSAQMDIFARYGDGIYEITKDEYSAFNRNKGISIDGVNTAGSIYMIKRNGSYLFMTKPGKNGTLCVLDGGRIKKANHKIEYYFNNLPWLIEFIKKRYGPYYQCLKSIADAVKQIGGNGEIHGCIINIDYYNHIYLNPADLKATCYFARDKYSRMVYANLDDLLENAPMLENRDTLKEAYRKNGGLQIISNSKSEMDKNMQIYRISEVMKKLQYAYEKNVLRFWRDDLLATDENLFETVETLEYDEI